MFLCLYVGGGGSHQVPKGLDGEVAEDTGAKFERRRERSQALGKGQKRKSVKDKDWILKKKEVTQATVIPIAFILIYLLSYIVKEGRRVFREIPSSLVANGKLCFERSVH